MNFDDQVRIWKESGRQDPMRVLESLTPGGSEFHNEAMYCGIYIKNRLDEGNCLWKENKFLMDLLIQKGIDRGEIDAYLQARIYNYKPKKESGTIQSIFDHKT